MQTAPDPAKWGSLALSQQPYAPTVDGDVVPAPPLETIAAGGGSAVRLLIGTTVEEARGWTLLRGRAVARDRRWSCGRVAQGTVSAPSKNWYVAIVLVCCGPVRSMPWAVSTVAVRAAAESTSVGRHRVDSSRIWESSG